MINGGAIFYEKKKISFKEIADAVKVFFRLIKEAIEGDVRIKKRIIGFCIFFSIAGLITFLYNYRYYYINTKTTTIEKTYFSSKAAFVGELFPVNAYALFTEDERCFFLRNTANILDVDLFEATVKPGMTIQLTYKVSEEHNKYINIVGLGVDDKVFFDFETIKNAQSTFSAAAFYAFFNLPTIAYCSYRAVNAITRRIRKKQAADELKL
ncbi:MAG: hypothetical protein IJL26_11870 [Clostridia bacterium]|nr:hypothetical protein [Clostridia bacterium]